MNYENLFLKPEKPFLILYHNEFKEFTPDGYNWCWFDTKDELIEFIEVSKKEFGGFTIDDVFEIGSIREVKL